jgi:hypothetical protein
MSGKNKEKTDWLNKLHDSAQEIDMIRMSLDFLSGSFESTGNITMARKLYSMSTRLDDSTKKIRSGASEAVSEGFRTAEQHSSNVLLAAIAGAAQTLEAKGDTNGAKAVAKAGQTILKSTSKKRKK